ncbi:SRPBCC family protein [Flaviaesturariibacter aridisoli]|uniref:Polyketide cyclase n=1 Tax=Flaviaesturariibacter aridisoli TaxID=2545761 RepID=A0A4R4E6F0_9BACT|nr:SRPBCC family protein [Flaviaesturariibacter aridisoli]TCZ74473.1 polyketide cyclase [Flaviaesturariibacter aridisoli]
MRIIKRILLFVVLLVATALVAAAFISKEFQVERSVLIEKPADSVFAYVKYLKNQNDFSKWAQMDPAMRKEFRGTDAQPGFVSAWESDKDDVGKGEQTIKSIDAAARRIDFTIHFIKPYESNAAATMVAEPKSAGSSEVRWRFQTHMAWPINLMSLFMKGAVGNDLQTGLNNLKTRLEAQR